VADRRNAGRRAKTIGQDFESWLKTHHGEAQRLGIVAGPVEHNEPHGEIINGQWEMVAPGVADFTGVLYDGHGSTLAVEAKSRARRLQKNEVSVKQQQYLDTVVRGGGLALLAVRLEGRNFVVPWAHVPWKVLRSTESVELCDLMPWEIFGSCYLDGFCPIRGVPAPGVAGGQQRRYARE
jgi:hypothetical protein